MNIRHEANGNKGRFTTEDGLSEMTYFHDTEQSIVIEHTHVHGSMEGKGVGKQLLTTLVAWARSQQIRVTPECSFAKAVFERTPEYADVWRKPENL